MIYTIYLQCVHISINVLIINLCKYILIHLYHSTAPPTGGLLEVSTNSLISIEALEPSICNIDVQKYYLDNSVNTTDLKKTSKIYNKHTLP